MCVPVITVRFAADRGGRRRGEGLGQGSGDRQEGGKDGKELHLDDGGGGRDTKNPSLRIAWRWPLNRQRVCSG
jgi:hypothetical protein